MESNSLLKEYLGFIENESEEDLVVNMDHLSARRMATLKAAAYKLKCLPNKIRFDRDYYQNSTEFSYDLLVRYLQERFKYDSRFDLVFSSDGYCTILTEIIAGGLYLHHESVKLKEKPYAMLNGLIAYFRPEYFHQVDGIFNELRNFEIKNSENKKPKIVCMRWDVEEDGESAFPILYLQDLEVNDPRMTDLDLHYGHGFSEIHGNLVDNMMKEDTHGLVLLHGLPGTGKTNYIRHLVKQLSAKKQVIYVSPDLVEEISKPMFFPFMLRQKGSILIVEDAENMIKSRDLNETQTQAITNLLNLTDGLLGDSFQQPIIATFNCKMSSIDSAFLRKGRLILQHKFESLCAENAQMLSDQLGFSSRITEPMVLADIYGQNRL